MNVPLQLKQFTHLTTEVAFSTGFIATTLVTGGCVATGRDEEPLEGGDVDAGDDAIVDVVHMDDAEARSHAYHAPPVADAPVVMPLALEDAPTTPPPSTALVPHAAAKKQRASKRRVAAPEYQETIDVVSRASRREAPVADDVVRADRGERRSPAASRKAKKDPTDQSFVPSYGRSVITPMGGRTY